MMGLGAWGYALGLIPGLLAVVGNTVGGVWTLGATVFLSAISFADWFVADDRLPPPDRPEKTPDLVLVLHVVLNSIAIATLLLGVATGTLMRWRVSAATLSTGWNSGISGIIVAHELIHRRGRGWRRAGIWNLLLVNYTHFFIEHVQGHHKRVGSRHDPATARAGESIYRFLLRSIPQQFLSALRIEANRLGRAGAFRYGLGNFVVAMAGLQLVIALTIRLVLGSGAMSAYLWQGAIAVGTLEVVNYLQHYGLVRTPGSRIEPAHSWQSDRISSRFLLLELPRHADHHCHSARPYHKLVSCDSSPRLPLGLLGTSTLIWIPPLWFHVAGRILEGTPTGETIVGGGDASRRLYGDKKHPWMLGRGPRRSARSARQRSEPPAR